MTSSTKPEMRITWQVRNAARAGPSHGHHITCIENLVKLARADRQTDRQTDMLITILRSIPAVQ